MTDTQERALVDETKALIREVEAGETAHAAWIAIRDRVQRLMESHTQPQVGALLDKSRSWVAKVLAWDVYSNTLPLQGPSQERARTKYHARQALQDPEQRREVIESLTEEDRLAIAHDAMEPEARDDRRRQKERHAHQQDKDQPHPERTHLELIANRLSAAELGIMSAISAAKGTEWSAEGTAQVEALIDQTSMRLDLLRMAVRGDDGLEAELAQLVKEES